MTVEERCGNPYLADKTWLYQRWVRVACRGCETYVWRDRAVAAQGPSWCSKACQERNETP